MGIQKFQLFSLFFYLFSRSVPQFFSTCKTYPGSFPSLPTPVPSVHSFPHLYSPPSGFFRIFYFGRKTNFSLENINPSLNSCSLTHNTLLLCSVMKFRLYSLSLSLKIIYFIEVGLLLKRFFDHTSCTNCPD